MPQLTLMLNPPLREAASVIADAVAKHRLLIVLGRCSVRYTGRGASRLGPGDRLVIVKPDGAVLVHRPRGYSPVNWQPESSSITAEETGEGLLLRSVRGRPREVLEVLFTRLDLVLAVEGLEDTAEFIEYLDESEIRDYLAEHPEEIEEGLHVIRKERPIGEGYADIVARDRAGNYVVIEVKRVTAGKDAVLQLHRYVEALRRENPEAKVRGILVAPSIAKDARTLLNSLGLEYKQIDVQRLYRKIAAAQARTVTQTRSILDFFKKKQEEKPRG